MQEPNFKVLTSPPQIALFAGIGVFWLAAYLLIIRRGFQDRCNAMPITAACLNISWEFICSFLYPFPGATVVVGIVWFLLDVLIVLQIVLYSKRDLDLEHLENWLFGLGLFSILVLSFVAVLIFNIDPDLAGGKSYEALGVPLGHSFISFGQNLLMSASYVAMILRRNSVLGQSIYIAIFKLIGTLLAAIGMLLYFPFSYLLSYCYAAIVILDVAYVFLVYRKCRDQSLNPWTRF
jgi:hypothetical protein